MPKKALSVIRVKKRLAKTYQIPVKVGNILLALLFTTSLQLPSHFETHATGCPDLKVIFIRGSGGERYTNGHYLAFKSSMEQKLKTTSLSYVIDDLDYPAVSIDVGDGHLDTLLGAFIGGGDAYEFGDSVHQGTRKLLKVVNDDPCKNTKYIFAGYSQGDIVLMNGLEKIDPDRVIYAATFGDPKIYLPEGAGPVPTACSGKNLSDYRIYVPDCRAYKGILGARDPYVSTSFRGKVGTWCNKLDILCSSHFSIGDHTHYAEDGLYEDASRFIFSKITTTFNIKNQYSSPHDTAILIDSTGSMSSLIEKYKNEALRLAEKTFAAGGRVALYDYRDLGDGYTPIERCNFTTCKNLDVFSQSLSEIQTGSGGDEPESLLSASLHVMKNLKWQLGSTKSLVVLTDAGYHSPDLDGTTFLDVKKLSKQIDPVNFYIITEKEHLPEYQSLAEATDGAVVSTVDDLSILTDTIMERYDSLPRVEEEFDNNTVILPHLEITHTESLSATEAKVSFKSDTKKTIVILNDCILGVTDQTDITLTNLKSDIKNNLTLVPISDDYRGYPVSTHLNTSYGGETITRTIIPKAPNTGRQ